MASAIKIKNHKEKTNLNRYAGQWVAFLDDKVVSNNDSLKGLVKELDSRGLREKSSVFLVPREEEGQYVFNLLGRNNFFQPFIISFFEKQKRVVLKSD